MWGLCGHIQVIPLGEAPGRYMHPPREPPPPAQLCSTCKVRRRHEHARPRTRPMVGRASNKSLLWMVVATWVVRRRKAPPKPTYLSPSIGTRRGSFGSVLGALTAARAG